MKDVVGYNKRSLIILERSEQAAAMMRNYSQYSHDLLPIDYNAKASLKGYPGRILSLLDFFDNEGHRYALMKTDDKLREYETQYQERSVQSFERYLLKFYFNYYSMLEYLIFRIKQLYEHIYYFRDNFMIGEDAIESPMADILERSGMHNTMISDIRSQEKVYNHSHVWEFINRFANNVISKVYGGHDVVLISNTSYNLLKAVRDETAQRTVEIHYCRYYTIKRFIAQIYFLLRSFFYRRSYKCADARFYIVNYRNSEEKKRDDFSRYLIGLLSIRQDLSALLKKLQPAYYVSQNADGFYAMINSEIKRSEIQCKTIMIPHGAELNPQDEWADLEEKYIANAQMNVNNEFDFTYIQSSLYEEYVKQHSLKNGFRYGNKIWGKHFGSFKKLQCNPKTINILYAASSFGYPGSLRFNNWLLHDELVRDIKAILGAISSDEFSFYIKLRQNVEPQLLIDDLRGYAGWKIIDVPFNFTEIMKNFDVFMTFRTTAIEEALYINKPVIIFDYTGRYQPVPIDNETVYHVTAENLPSLPAILKSAKSAPPESFRKYRLIEEPLFD